MDLRYTCDSILVGHYEQDRSLYWTAVSVSLFGALAWSGRSLDEAMFRAATIAAGGHLLDYGMFVEPYASVFLVVIAAPSVIMPAHVGLCRSVALCACRGDHAGIV